MTIDELVDEFVALVNRGPRDLRSEEDLTPTVGSIAPEDWRYWTWQVTHFEARWIDEVEAKLPAGFPPSFRSLYGRYIFPPLDVGGIWLFGNTPEGLPNAGHEMRTGIFQDKLLSECLVNHGYIQFARPAWDNYDPICFDTSRRSGGGEYHVVQLDHEAILCHSEIDPVKEPFPTFRTFLEQIVRGIE